MVSVILLISLLCLVLSLQDCGAGRDDLTQFELQICVDFVNTVVQEEHDCKLNIFTFSIEIITEFQLYLSLKKRDTLK